jgi:hypothetical protein
MHDRRDVASDGRPAIFREVEESAGQSVRCRFREATIAFSSEVETGSRLRKRVKLRI